MCRWRTWRQCWRRPTSSAERPGEGAGTLPIHLTTYPNGPEGGRREDQMNPQIALLGAAALVAGQVGTCVAYENANGSEYFALQVPDPSSMVVNGYDDFVRATDDILNIDEVALDAGWRDDDLEVITDADHSGTFHGPADAIRSDHQQWTFHIPTPGGYPQIAYLSKYFPDGRLAPGEVVEWTEWMYPYQETGGLSYANEDVALSYARDLESGTVTLALCPSAPY